jgi:antitoxin VapB
MPLNIKNRATHELARRLAKITGETITQAVGTAVRERLRRIEAQETGRTRRLADRLEAIADHCAGLPVLRDRTADEILGLDEKGMPR